MLPDKLPDINLLPYRERKESLWYKIFLLILLLCVLLSAAMIFYFYKTKSDLDKADQQLAQLETKQAALQTKVKQAEENQKDPFVDIVQYIEAKRLPASVLLNGLIGILPEHGYLSEFKYELGTVEIETQFETMQAASDYMAALDDIDYIEEPRIENVESFSLKNENLDVSSEEGVAVQNPYDVLPRYEVTFTFSINDAKLAKAKEQAEKEGAQHE